jgi:cell division protein FtsQ
MKGFELTMRARPVSLRPRRPRIRTVLLSAVLVVLLVAGWFWLRDSSLVAVKTVTVTGITGAQADEVRAALDDAGRDMTTLHVRAGALDTAVRPFSIVKRIEVSADFPSTLRVHVVTNVAVAAVTVDERAIPVTADGTLLRDVTAHDDLPTVPLRAAPGGDRVTEGLALRALAALGAAPRGLRARVEEVGSTPEHGLELELANGPQVWFGDGERLAAKWAATAAVLADEEAAGATYIDVTAPGRPAVGGLPDGAPAAGDSDVPELPEGFGTVEPGADTTTPDDGTVVPEDDPVLPDDGQ